MYDTVKVNHSAIICVFVGDLPQRVRGGPVWRLGKHEPGSICCPKHKIWYKVWSRSQGLLWTFPLCCSYCIYSYYILIGIANKKHE